MLISYSNLAGTYDHNLHTFISKVHQDMVIKTLTGNKIKKPPASRPLIDTVTLAAGDLCMTAVRAWMVDTAKRSRWPWNTWKQQVQKLYTNAQRQSSSKIYTVPSCQEGNQELANMLPKSSSQQSRFHKPKVYTEVHNNRQLGTQFERREAFTTHITLQIFLRTNKFSSCG